MYWEIVFGQVFEGCVCDGADVNGGGGDDHGNGHGEMVAMVMVMILWIAWIVWRMAQQCMPNAAQKQPQPKYNR